MAGKSAGPKRPAPRRCPGCGTKKGHPRKRVDVVHYLPLVEKIARQMARQLPAHVDIDELTSAGVMGLLDAAERFDPKRADRFEVFAEFRIRGSIRDYLRSNDSLSRDMRRLSTELVKAARVLEAKTGHAPDQEEIARHLGITVDELYARQRQLTGSTVIGIDDAGPDLLEHYADPQATDALEIASHHQETARLVACINELPKKMQEVLSLYYVEEMTFDEIGKVMGVTMSRICQIHREATAKLRVRCAHRGDA